MWNRIGAGNGALGQATGHWGRLITCPNRWFPTPIPPSAPVPPAHALPQWVVSCPEASRCTRSAPWRRRRWPTTAPGRISQRWNRGAASQRCLHLYSDTTLCKCYNACKAWYRFENTTSLANRARVRPTDEASLRERGSHCSTGRVAAPRTRLPFGSVVLLAELFGRGADQTFSDAELRREGAGAARWEAGAGAWRCRWHAADPRGGRWPRSAGRWTRCEECGPVPPILWEGSGSDRSCGPD